MLPLSRPAILAASLLLFLSLEAFPALTRVGAAGGVSGQVLAMAPESGEGVNAGVGRVLSSGKTVYYNDKIATDATGRLQVLLLDETVFTIGPNSEMYIDEFVFDPADTSKNKVTARVTKGVFRFVTGSIARKDPNSMKVKIPMGTIGIRGTIAGGSVSESGSLIALLGPGANNNAGEKPGAVDVTTSGGAVTISAPGFATTITGGGEAPPTPPAPLTQQQQQQISTEPPPADAGSGGEGGQTGSSQQSDGGESATQDAASDSASAQQSGADAGVSQLLAQTFSKETNTAAQEAALGIVDGIAQWVDVLTIQTGQGAFSGSGLYTCVSGCEGGQLIVSEGEGVVTGDAEFNLVIDFGAKTIGGNPGGNNNSYISLEGEGAGVIEGWDQIDIVATPFGSEGLARITLGSEGADNGGNFSGTTLDLINQDGQAAHHAQMNLSYTTEATALTSGPIDSGTLQPLQPEQGEGE